MRKLIKSTVRPVALTTIAPITGFLLILVLEILLKIELSKLHSSVVNLVMVSFIAFTVFPKWLGIPFGRIATREFLHKVGFYFPVNAWKHLLLGLILSLCTLSGMLIASILTGKYTMDMSTVNLPHIVFSLNPALWEELFYRGILMALLIKITKSLKKAFIIQIVLFGLIHIKKLYIWDLVDTLSVVILAAGFTYVAYKTRVLIAGIVFHYFHDALLYFVQLPDGKYAGVTDNTMFYGILWLMIVVGCVITKLMVEKFRICAPRGLYNLEST